MKLKLIIWWIKMLACSAKLSIMDRQLPEGDLIEINLVDVNVSEDCFSTCWQAAVQPMINRGKGTLR